MAAKSVTKSAKLASFKSNSLKLLPWLGLAVFVYLIYFGANSSLIGWLSDKLDFLTRWPSPSVQTVNNTQLLNSSRQNSLASANKVLPGSWQMARVLGQITSTHHWLLIAAGSNSGIKVGQPAVVNGYLAGIIWQVKPSEATVVLLGDPDFSVAAMVINSSSDGLVETKNGGLVLDNVLGRPNITDKLVVTSGAGGILPAGLPIGTVTAEITSSVNNQSSWGVSYPGVAGQLWVAVNTGNRP